MDYATTRKSEKERVGCSAVRSEKGREVGHQEKLASRAHPRVKGKGGCRRSMNNRKAVRQDVLLVSRGVVSSRKSEESLKPKARLERRKKGQKNALSKENVSEGGV